MGRILYNNEAGQISNSLPGNGNTAIIKFINAPNFATLASPNYIPLVLAPGAPNFEIVWLTAYTAGSLTGTITRNVEDNGNWAPRHHPPGEFWVCAATVQDLGTGTLTGDVSTTGVSGATVLNATANVESIIRASASLDQINPPAASLNLNTQKVSQLAVGNLGTDAATLQQSPGPWISEAAFAWTYVSATQFTVGSNRTFLYTPGTKLQWFESSAVRYGVVHDSSFGSGVMTVNMVPTSDFVMGVAGPDVNSNSVSYGSPFGFPTRFTWVPTGFTGFSANPSSPFAWWSVQNGICDIAFSFFSVGTSNAGTFTLTAPIACSLLTFQTCRVEDNGNLVAGLANVATSTITLIRLDAVAFQSSGSKSAWLNMRYPL